MMLGGGGVHGIEQRTAFAGEERRELPHPAPQMGKRRNAERGVTK
jgi:hypothetical protein